MPDTAEKTLRRRYPDHEWTPLAARTAHVHRLHGDPALVVKTAPRPAGPDPGLDLATEAATCAWLADQGVRCPTPVDTGTLDDHQYLVMTAAPGIPLDGDLPADLREPAVDAVARATARLHRLPVTACGFDRRLRVTIPMAQESAGLGEVDLDDLDPPRRGWDVTRLTTELLTQARLIGREEVAVCHGDLTPGNVLIDPDDLTVAFVDTARLGLADRYSDLALFTRDLTGTPGFGPAAADRFLHHYGEAPVDPQRLEFYRLLDEFR
ncbi:aminoglycoside 3'-phosphotransferase [Stackebrandtia albiflava]|uniref:aminoglycoside 3'-phosphotransferase n=1 Tax=Stackebrandtia albiflava TaxID=406432 RepID=UPI0031E67318